MPNPTIDVTDSEKNVTFSAEHRKNDSDENVKAIAILSQLLPFSSNSILYNVAIEKKSSLVILGVSALPFSMKCL